MTQAYTVTKLLKTTRQKLAALAKLENRSAPQELEYLITQRLWHIKSVESLAQVEGAEYVPLVMVEEANDEAS